MRMSELIEGTRMNMDRPEEAKALAAALATTGPLLHKGHTWRATITPTGFTVHKDFPPAAESRDAAAVDVP